jgi:hypothetical protein
MLTLLYGKAAMFVDCIPVSVCQHKLIPMILFIYLSVYLSIQSHLV